MALIDTGDARLTSLSYFVCVFAAILLLRISFRYVPPSPEP